MRITRRGWLLHLRSARLGAAVWLLAFVAAITALPVLHTAFHEAAHGHDAAHTAARDPFALPSYVHLVGEDPAAAHSHGDGEVHRHAEPKPSALAELDPILALQVETPAHRHHGASAPEHEHPGSEHGEGSLEHLDAAWLAGSGIATAPPAASVDGVVAVGTDAPARENYLLSPLQPQAPPARAAKT